MDLVWLTSRSTHREEERKRTTHSVSALERKEDSLCECLGEERKRMTHSVSALEQAV